MKIIQEPTPALVMLDWSDLQILIGAPPDSISDVRVDSMGYVVLKINADQVENVRKSIYEKFAIFGVPLPVDMYRTSWIQEVDDVYLNNTCKIAAIKKIRELSKCGLREAKEWVEHWFTQDGKFLPHPGPIPF